MATYRKRSTGWRAEIARQGVRESRTFDTKAQAVAWATQREEEILAGVAGTPLNKTLRDLLERYVAEESPKKRGARWEIIRITAWLKTDERGRPASELGPLLNKSVSSLAASDIAAVRNQRLKTVTAASVNRELTLLRAALEIARREWLWLPKNPMTDVKRLPEPPSRDRRISDDEAQRICFALGYIEGETPTRKTHNIACAFLFALATAMRAGEICKLRAENVFRDKRYLTVIMSKNGESRDVPLSSRALEILSWLPTHADGSVFGVDSGTLCTLFRRARENAGIVDLHFHDTRHEAITRLSQLLDVRDLARMTGHKDLKSLMIYYNATATEIADRLGRVQIIQCK